MTPKERLYRILVKQIFVFKNGILSAIHHHNKTIKDASLRWAKRRYEP